MVEGVEETFTVRLEAVDAEDAPLIGLDRATITIIDINGEVLCACGYYSDLMATDPFPVGVKSEH